MTFGVPADDRLLDVTLTAGQTVIDTDFPVLADADLTIVRVRAGVETALVLNTDYSLADVGELGYKRITLAVAAEASDRVVIRGTRTADRSSNLLSGEMRASVFNAEYRSLIVLIQELVRDHDLTLRRDPIDDLSVAFELPLKADRLGKFLRFNGVTGAPEMADATTEAPVFRIVTAAPSAGLGNDGDIALWINAADAEHGNVYSKASGAWSLQGNIRGPAGTAGTGVPAGGALHEVLRKASADDYDVEWGAPSGGGGGTVSDPQGRLTLSSGVPVMTSSIAAAGTVYWTPYRGNVVWLHDGATAWASYELSELSLSLAGLTASRLHDIFLDNNGGTPQLAAVAWTNDTTRATALTKQDGRYVLTGATDYLYLGTIYVDGSNQCTHRFGTSATSGQSAHYGVWNHYNRVLVAADVGDSTDNWTYNSGVNATWRNANASTHNRVTFVIGVAEDAIMAEYVCFCAATTSYGDIGIGLNSSTVNSGSTGAAPVGVVAWPSSYLAVTPSAGLNYVQAIERNQTNAGSLTVYGDAGVSGSQYMHLLWKGFA